MKVTSVNTILLYSGLIKSTTHSPTKSTALNAAHFATVQCP